MELIRGLQSDDSSMIHVPMFRFSGKMVSNGIYDNVELSTAKIDER